tara:strand:- start:461 stop:1414 length:954 start_codon:yes stop_codon:yes gene_type:complete
VSKYVNPMYQEPEHIKKRRLWLRDKITQTGHEPEKYEKWIAELSALNRKPIHTPTKKTSSGQWPDPAKLTDSELAALFQKVQSEKTRRHLARQEAEKAKIKEQCAELSAKGWRMKSQAFGEVRRVIIERKIFDDINTTKDLTDRVIEKMVKGERLYSAASAGVGPMQDGIFKYGQRENQVLIDTKKLLCHLINQIKGRQAWEKQKKEREELARQEAVERRARDAALSEFRKHKESLHREAQRIVYEEMTEEHKNSPPEPEENLSDHERMVKQLKMQTEWFKRVNVVRERLWAEMSESVPPQIAAQSPSNAEQEEQNG